jgi:thymidylate synthase ThyX
MNKTNRISAEIIADSINEKGDRITSFIVTCPRIVLAEFNTHRMLSRNSASSRAIPFETMVKKVQEEPFIPIKWQKDHKGMQGTEYEVNPIEIEIKNEVWIQASRDAVRNAKELNRLDTTKQLCNRLLEPFLYHTIIVTATDWENFFALRAHDAAEIHIADLAYKMLKLYNENTPKKLNPGEWHIPFGDKMDFTGLTSIGNETTIMNPMLRVKIATARCARVSYLNYEGKDDYSADLKLHDRLASMGHWSPFEHCAKAMTPQEMHDNIRGNRNEIYNKVSGWSGNFKGFIQYRKTFVNENKKDGRVLTKI